ncbi:hypothetical protein CO051_03295 [Candidatus Roizmanbacteria bacterium CG_4_9_14_0_2_um_filter_39_13]|uniref:ComEC/Rec2-related protein domain-containing protein n=1 Tax=Candidatus Roizmanbacteria bacterium CG_4_9_14_0_2_um_filter_39_13 TaxID=1974839 RepID=A0A2M8EZI3_9BACT|nr:MAG: hypothetical protein CO051_03295 [Candidatus Roizmanbacteria bacterium CG_4_9_14_0_2_um_filter_39_13]
MNLLIELVNSYFPEPHASLLNGILLGRKLFVTNTFYNQLKEVGLIHIVVLSGMNITLLTAIIMNTIVGYIGRKLASILTIVIIVSFVLFVGAEAPIVRAAIMGILSLIGLLYGRKAIALYLLFLSGLGMVIINHEWLTSISFQLSFSATLGIILFGSMEHEEESVIPDPIVILIRQLAEKNPYTSCHSERAKRLKNPCLSMDPSVVTHVPTQDDKNPTSNIQRLKSYFIEELRISLSAQVFTLPIIFWYFRQISFVSPLANILVAWLIAPIMILGILTIILGFVSWQLGFVFSWLLYPPLSFIVWVVENLAKIPFGSIRL